MPQNNHAEQRYKTLDRCFSDFNHYYTFEDLLDIVNEDLDYMYGCKIKTRQLREDINLMKGSLFHCAPIECYKIKQDGRPFYYYRYSDRNFSIYKNELSREELQSLRSTIEMLHKYCGGQANAWLNEVISKLECKFEMRGNTENLVSFAQNEQLKGLEYLSHIIEATTIHKALTLKYCTHKGEEFEGIIHPYFVKQYNNRWFLFGLDDVSDKLVNRALDRIIKIKDAEVKFKENDKFDFAHYFDDIVGVSVPYAEEMPVKEEIVLKFSKERYPYVLSKPLHRTQDPIDEVNCLVSINVIPTRELDQQILSYGPDVEVVSPEWYRNQIFKKIEENYNKYFAVQKDCIAAE